MTGTAMEVNEVGVQAQVLTEEKGVPSSREAVGLPEALANCNALKKYKGTVKTSELSKTGTSSSIHFVLTGSRGQSEAISLGGSVEKAGQSGQVDSFEIESRDLGQLQTLTVITDGSGQGWHLSMVTVLDMATGIKTFFWCNDWIKDRTEIAAQSRDPQENIFKYKVPTPLSSIINLQEPECGKTPR